MRIFSYTFIFLDLSVLCPSSTQRPFSPFFLKQPLFCLFVKYGSKKRLFIIIVAVQYSGTHLNFMTQHCVVLLWSHLGSAYNHSRQKTKSVGCFKAKVGHCSQCKWAFIVTEKKLVRRALEAKLLNKHFKKGVSIL